MPSFFEPIWSAIVGSLKFDPLPQDVRHDPQQAEGQAPEQSAAAQDPRLDAWPPYPGMYW